MPDWALLLLAAKRIVLGRCPRQDSPANHEIDLAAPALPAHQPAVLARIRRAFHVEVSVRSLFDGPSIDDLGKAVAEAKASGAVPRVQPIVSRPRPATG